MASGENWRAESGWGCGEPGGAPFPHSRPRQAPPGSRTPHLPASASLCPRAHRAHRVTLHRDRPVSSGGVSAPVGADSGVSRAIGLLVYLVFALGPVGHLPFSRAFLGILRLDSRECYGALGEH